MATMLIFAVVLVGMYAVVLGVYVVSLRRHPEEVTAGRPWLAVWLVARFATMPEAVPIDRRLSTTECEKARELMRGSLPRVGYQAAMAAVAARDAAVHPLRVPQLRP